MATGFDDGQKTEILSRTDIIDLIGEHVALKKSGRHHRGLCPFHVEKTPSFFVNAERQSFKCYGCGAGGDALSFVMKHDGMTFPEALELLAKRAGVTLAPRKGGASPGKPTYSEITASACEFYHRLLVSHPSGAAARNYLKQRRIDDNRIESFKLGFGGADWDSCSRYLIGKGFKEPDIEATGLALRGQRGTLYDRFRGRLIFPIFGSSGQVVGFGGRILAGEGVKYVNSPETAQFKKSQMLFGLNLARRAIVKAGQAVVMEGYTDVIMAHQCGFENVVATLGTALTEQHVMILKRLGVDVTLVYDGDGAGQAAADKSVALFLQQEVNAKVVTLAGGLDPCEALVAEGAPAFAKQLDGGRELLEYKLAGLGGKFDMQSVSGRSQAMRELATLLGSIDALDTLKQNFLIQKISGFFGVPESDLRQYLGRSVSTQRHQTQTRRRQDDEKVPGRPDPVEKAEIWILEALLEGGALGQEAVNAVSVEHFTDPQRKNLMEAVVRMGAVANFQEIMNGLADPQVRQLAGEIHHDDSYRNVSEEKRVEHRRAKLAEALAFFERTKRSQASMSALKGRKLDGPAAAEWMKTMREQKAGHRQ